MDGLDGKTDSSGGKFNFKVKIVQTDLSGGRYFFGGDAGGDYLTSQNSSYISKLYDINNYSGGILAKEKIEDTPERYRWFVKLENPSEAQMIKSFKKDIITLANREEVGQNVFYSRLSNPEILDNANMANIAAKTASASASASVSGPVSVSSPVSVSGPAPGANLREAEYTQAKPGPRDNSDKLDKLDNLESFAGFGDFANYDSSEGLEGFERAFFFDVADGDYDEYSEEYEDCQGDEEIRDILHLNNYYNSDMYKMSKIEYDFSTPGNINITDDGAIELKYSESEMTGIEDSFIQFLFRPENRDIVTIRRKNFFDVWFSLEKGKRISVERRGKYSGSVLTTHTKELVNKMTAGGGEMRFVYVNETDGAPSEMIFHSICAEPSGDK